MIAKQSIGKSFSGALNYNLKKMNSQDPKERAELLATNFTSMEKAMIRKELAVMKALNPKLKRNTWHTSLNFAIGENISNDKMRSIAEEYMKQMGFDNNLHFIFRHHDTAHTHCHILALRNKFDGTVVSDSHNYQKSEAIIRELETRYELVKVKSSKYSKSKALNKDELEMIQRTGNPSNKLLLQEKVIDALNHSITMRQFINHLEINNVNVLFNQASTGRVSGISFMIQGFKIRGQALGNQFKFGSIIKEINYEQNRDGQAISQANCRTRERFGATTKAGLPKDIPGIGIPYSKKWYHYQKSRNNIKLPEIPFGLNSKKQWGEYKVDQRNEGHKKGSKETTSHMGHYFPHNRNTLISILGGMVDLLDDQLNSSNEQRKASRNKKLKL